MTTAGVAIAATNRPWESNVVYFHFQEFDKDLVRSKLRGTNGIRLMRDGSVVTELSRNSDNHIKFMIFSNIEGWLVISVTADFNTPGLPILNKYDPGNFIRRVAFRRVRNMSPYIFLYVFRIDFVQSTDLSPLEQQFWLDEYKFYITETGSLRVNLQSATNS